MNLPMPYILLSNASDKHLDLKLSLSLSSTLRHALTCLASCRCLRTTSLMVGLFRRGGWNRRSMLVCRRSGGRSGQPSSRSGVSTSDWTGQYVPED